MHCVNLVLSPSGKLDLDTLRTATHSGRSTVDSLEDSLAQVAKVSAAAGLDGEKVRKHANLSSIIATVSDRASTATVVAKSLQIANSH